MLILLFAYSIVFFNPIIARNHREAYNIVYYKNLFSREPKYSVAVYRRVFGIGIFKRHQDVAVLEINKLGFSYKLSNCSFYLDDALSLVGVWIKQEKEGTFLYLNDKGKSKKIKLPD